LLAGHFSLNAKAAKIVLGRPIGRPKTILAASASRKQWPTSGDPLSIAKKQTSIKHASIKQRQQSERQQSKLAEIDGRANARNILEIRLNPCRKNADGLESNLRVPVGQTLTIT